MKSQLWKGFTGTGSRVQVGKQGLSWCPDPELGLKEEREAELEGVAGCWIVAVAIAVVLPFHN